MIDPTSSSQHRIPRRGLTSISRSRRAEKFPGHILAFNIHDRKEYPSEEFVFIDCDDACDPETGAIHPVVREHLERAESYADVSTSGTEVHLFARGTLPDGLKAIDASFPAADIDI